jgi:hypothetical protein
MKQPRYLRHALNGLASAPSLRRAYILFVFCAIAWVGALGLPNCSGINAGSMSEPLLDAAPPHSPNELRRFAFEASANPGLAADVVATIAGDTVAVTVPFGTNVTSLRASFSHSGASVSVGGAPQESNVTPNDFSRPVEYVVTGTDGATRRYTVTLTVASSSANELTSFSFLKTNNPTLSADAAGVISGNRVAVALPYGINLNGLKASFQSTGASVLVGGVLQTSGLTANDFTAPVTYVVTAADGGKRTYEVTVTSASQLSKDLTSFAFYSLLNSALGADVTATVTGQQVSATVPAGTDVTALVASFETTGSEVSVNGVAQQSGITPNDFSNPVMYTVSAADGSTKTYTVTVTVAPSSAKEITSFAVLSVHNPSIAFDIVATIVGSSIDATVPFGTEVSALKASFQTTGVSVVAANVPQTSGVSALNYKNPAPLVVRAADGTTRTYTVTVTRAPSAAKEITSFQFLSALNPLLPSNVTALISGTSITATLPFGSLRSGLRASFQSTAGSVTV